MKNKKIAAIIQARMGSSRLPGKVLFPILGRPILFHLIERLRQSEFIKDIIVATSTNILDNAIENFCIENYISCYRGPEYNVAVRVLNAAEKFQCFIIVDITGDCPLVDPAVIDNMIYDFFMQRDKNLYSSNVYPERTWPDGFDFQIYHTKTLEQAIKQIPFNSPHKEHSGWNIPQYLSNITIRNLKIDGDNLSHWGLTLDTEEDYLVIKTIFEHFKDKKYFSYDDVINYISENNWILDINSKIKRNIPGGP